MGDYAPWAELRAISRDHLTPWEPVWQRDELSRSSFRRRVRHYQREAREDLGYAFLIFSDADDQLVGGLTLSNVRRGVTQAAVLGYWLGKPFVCRGYMTEAVRAAVALRPSSRCICTASKPRRCRTTWRPSACWSATASAAKASRAGC